LKCNLADNRIMNSTNYCKCE